MARSPQKKPTPSAAMRSPKRASPVAEVGPRSPLIGRSFGEDDLTKLGEKTGKTSNKYDNSSSSMSVFHRVFNRRTAVILVAGVAVAVAAAGRAGALSSDNGFSGLFVVGDKANKGSALKSTKSTAKTSKDNKIKSRKKRRLDSKSRSKTKSAVKSSAKAGNTASVETEEIVDDASVSPARSGSKASASKSSKSKESASRSADDEKKGEEEAGGEQEENGEEEDGEEEEEEDKPPAYKPSVDARNAAVSSFAFLSFLLLLGKTLRVLVKPLRDLFLPSSVG
jgi:hypothetical protein